MTTSHSPTPHPGVVEAATSRLRADLDGRVAVAGDDRWEAARRLFYPGPARRPALAVRPADAAQVARVVAMARETGLDLSVRSGGHGFLAHAVADGGIVLDLSVLDALDVDVPGRTARAGAGLTAGAYTRAVGVHGLATGFGDTGSVGIGGLTLGGGVGLLSRRHGLTIDSLLAAEVVTADGRVRHVDAEREPDLFWALRGGGGNFGVATRFRFRLHEVSSVVGGLLVLPATADVVAGFVAAAEQAPDALSTIANVTAAAPPLPFLPEEVHGQRALIAIVAFAGDADAGRAVLDEFRALATPLADMTGPMAYPDLFPPDDEHFPFRATARTMFVDEFDRDAAAAVLAHLDESTAAMASTQLRVLGGAIARVPEEATAYAHRRRRVMVNVAAAFADASEEAAHRRWVEGLAGVLGPGDRGGYVNFLGVDDPDTVRAAYPGGTWERLRALKRRYDPDNVFHHNANIPPA